MANYLGQFYQSLIGVVMLPVYIKYIGPEAYGLVGFFAMLQAWFQLLDMGLTPTMARQTAIYQAGGIDAQKLRGLLCTLECVFIGVALLGAGSIFFAANSIATQWLKVQTLPLSEVRNAVILIGIIVALRWSCGLYRGAINGFEKLVWLSGWNTIIATLRFVLVIPFIIMVGTSPTIFFSYQLGVAIIELAALVFKTYRLMPKVKSEQRSLVQWRSLRTMLKFSLSIAFTSTVWVLVTQTDKLLLSKLLPLAEYGYFTLAVLVASGVSMLSGPISGAILPRMTRLQAAGDESGLIQLYKNATQLIAVVAAPAVLILFFFSEQVLWAWTGDAMLVRKVAPVVMLYAAGSGLLTLGAFPYYLQFAKGDLKLHVIGSLLFFLLLVPSLILATLYFGMIGTGWAWLLANLTYFLLWVPFVHQRFARGLHISWLKNDVICTIMPVIFFAWIVQSIVPWPVSRVAMTAQLCILGILFLGISSLSSRKVRTSLANLLRSCKAKGVVHKDDE